MRSVIIKVLACTAAFALPAAVFARDDGRFAASPLKSWFESLATEAGGACCALADGIVDIAWETTPDGHYRVHVWGTWIVVPDEAVLKVPNRLGRAVAWPYVDDVPGGIRIQIKCFMPGPEG